jgi:hypothetical protein
MLSTPRCSGLACAHLQSCVVELFKHVFYDTEVRSAYQAGEVKVPNQFALTGITGSHTGRTIQMT